LKRDRDEDEDFAMDVDDDDVGVDGYKEKEKNGRNSRTSVPFPLTHLRPFLCFAQSLRILIALLSGAAVRAAKLASPTAPGSRESPEGVPDRLIRLSFVLTGKLSAFSREEAIVIAKVRVLSPSHLIHSLH
jgi:replication factor C subunit 1